MGASKKGLRPAMVVGAGVVGLACSVELARRGWWVIVAEREATFGLGASSRNSEVIHAGIYYAPGSLKARLCLEGRDRLYSYLAEHALPFRRCGKLIVATENDDIAELRTLAERAVGNGVEDLRWLEPGEVRAREPKVQALAALESPSSGILDVHALMYALSTEACAAGVDFAFSSEVVDAEPDPDGWRVGVATTAGNEEVEVALVVNAAGLHADRLARVALPNRAADLPRQKWVKGSYFSIQPNSRVQASRLVYPCPVPDLRGLGIHLTVDLNRGLRLGPDVEPTPSTAEDYRVDAGRRSAFWKSARNYLPGLHEGDLAPAFAGLRPQIEVEAGFRDFYIAREDRLGAPAWINLIGIDSPGLTCALAIARLVADMAEAAPAA